MTQTFPFLYFGAGIRHPFEHTCLLVHTLATVVDAGAVSGADVYVQAVVPSGAPYSSSVAELVINGGTTVEDFHLLVVGGKVMNDDPTCSCSWDVDPFGVFIKPDPFFAIWLDGLFLGTSGTEEDTRFPLWNTFTDANVPVGSDVFIDVWDDDSGFQGSDNFVGTVVLTHDDLQGIVDVGVTQVIGDGALLWLKMDVESL